jgi:predicted ATPase
MNIVMAMGADPGILALVYLGLKLSSLGYPDQGLAAARRAFALGSARPNSFSMAWGLQGVAMMYLLRGAVAEALETAEALITLCREQGFPHWLAQGMIIRAAALSWLDSPGTAIPLLEDALATRQATGARISWPGFSVPLVSAYLRAGEIEAGLAIVTELLEHIEHTNDRDSESHLWRFRGQLFLARGKEDEAEGERCLEKALAVARHQGARLFELTAATDLARLWQQQGKPEAALELLGPIYAWFTEGFQYSELRGAHALLDELSKP